jgi:hypothetical protein
MISVQLSGHNFTFDTIYNFCASIRLQFYNRHYLQFLITWLQFYNRHYLQFLDASPRVKFKLRLLFKTHWSV